MMSQRALETGTGHGELMHRKMAGAELQVELELERRRPWSSGDSSSIKSPNPLSLVLARDFSKQSQRQALPISVSD
jgi:hypothetical protein